MVEETYNCSEECGTLDASMDQNQLAYRLIKLRIRVLRANIGKLLCLCVPEREKWTEFGWDGLTVDEILDDLSKIDIPSHHPGDTEFQNSTISHNTVNREYEIENHSPNKFETNFKKEEAQLNQENMDSSSLKDKTTRVDTHELGIVAESNECETDEYIEIVDTEDAIDGM